MGACSQLDESRDEGPTAAIMRSYQAEILDWCMRSMKVSVHVTLRMTPNTEMSAKSGCAPPWNLHTRRMPQH